MLLTILIYLLLFHALFITYLFPSIQGRRLSYSLFYKLRIFIVQFGVKIVENLEVSFLYEEQKLI